jgi:hypothetical protein
LLRVRTDLDPFESEEVVPLFVLTADERLSVERLLVERLSVERLPVERLLVAAFSLVDVDLEFTPSLVDVDLEFTPSLEEVDLELLTPSPRTEPAALLRNDELLPTEDVLSEDTAEREPEEREFLA